MSYDSIAHGIQLVKSTSRFLAEHSLNTFQTDCLVRATVLRLAACALPQAPFSKK